MSNAKGDGDRILVQVKLRKAVVKLVDHACVELEKTRSEVVEEILSTWLPQFGSQARANS